METPPKSKSIVVAGGCFWCVEAIFDDVKGVIAAENCYAGGHIKNPTYAQICQGNTGHAEGVKITYDPAVVSSRDLLKLFMVIHDPTTLNRQGPDSGTQYRSTIFYTNDAEKKIAEEVIEAIKNEGIYRSKIVTTIEPLINYTRAEEYHQDYFSKYEKATPAERAKMNAGYCSAVIEPKVLKFRKQYTERLKKGG